MTVQSDLSNSIMIIVLLLLVMIQSGFSFPAYDCSGKVLTTDKVSLSSVKECVADPKNVTGETHLIQVVQPQMYSEVMIYQCLVSADHILTRCGKSIDTAYEGSLSQEIIAMDRKSCLKLIRFGTLDYYINGELTTFEGFSANKLNSRSFVSHGSISGSASCTAGAPLHINGKIYDKPLRNTKMTVTYRKYKADITLSSGEVNLQGGVVCPYSDYECFDVTLGNVFWESPEDSAFCGRFDKFDVIYEGYGRKITDEKGTQFYLFNHSDSTFNLEILGGNHTCGSLLLITEQPRLFIVEETPGFPFRLKKKEIYVKNLNMRIHLDVKIQMAVKGLSESITDLFKQMIRIRCDFRREAYFRFLTLAKLSPPEFAYDYFQKSGYTAVVHGEVIHLVRCSVVEVKLRNTPGFCYNQMPVSYKNNSYFLNARTKIISKIGEPIECSNIMPAMFFVEGQWWKLIAGQWTQAESPRELDPNSKEKWVFPKAVNLARLGLYDEESLEKLDNIILTPVHRQAMGANIIDYAAGKIQTLPGGAHLIRQFDKDSFLEEATEKMTSKFKELTGSLSYWGGLLASLLAIGSAVGLVLKALSMIINFGKIYEITGCSIYLCCSCLDSAVSWAVYKRYQEGNKGDDDVEMHTVRHGEEIPAIESGNVDPRIENPQDSHNKASSNDTTNDQPSWRRGFFNHNKRFNPV